MAPIPMGPGPIGPNREPLRIAATLILTPFVAKLFGRTPQSALTE